MDSDSQPGRARSFGSPRAASARSNRPNTADPEPDMAANDRAGIDQRLPDPANRRVMPDHRGLQVVPQGRGPGRPDRRHRPTGTGFRGAAGFLVEPPVGIHGRDAETRAQDQHDVHRRHVGERIDVVAAAEAERGAADQEERHVGAEARADARQRRDVEIRASTACSAPAASSRHSTLPPPRPASDGMRLRRSIAMSRGRRRLARRDAMQERRRLPHQIARSVGTVGLVAGHGQRAAPLRHVTLSKSASD